MSASDVVGTTERWLEHQAQGNGCVLVIVDSGAQEAYGNAGPTLFAALDHFGIPFNLIDLARTNLETSLLGNQACILLAQPGITSKLTGARASAIRDAVDRGIGLVSLDHRLEHCGGPLQASLGLEPMGGGAVRRSALRVENARHFVTARRDRPSLIHLARPIDVTPAQDTGWHASGKAFVTTLDHLPVLMVGSYGQGRWVQWLISPELWLNNVLGHAAGLDDLFWRSIVWAARKPFVMRAMPPFLVVLIDDCSSSYNHFGYLAPFVRHGYLPHLELFLYDVNRVFHEERDLDSRALKAKYDEGLVSVAAHAFAYNRQIYFDHDRGSAYDDGSLARNFAQFDEAFSAWGIQPSSFVNAHFGEIGLNALPYLLDRGIQFYGGIHPFGEAWFGDDSKRLDWRPAPYGQRGFLHDYMPDHPGFFAIKAQIDPVAYTSEQRADADCLWGNTIFWDENQHNDVIAAAAQAVRQIELGLNSGFYGCLYTHEQRLAVLPMPELDRFLGLVAEAIQGFDPIPCKLDVVARYARCTRESRIVEVQIDPLSRQLRCTLTGKADLATCIQVFDDEGTEVRQRVLNVRPFEGALAVEG